MKKRVPWVSHDEEKIKRFRKDPEFALGYLNTCIEVAFEENDPELILTAIASVAKAFGMTQVALGAALKRESLHRMLSRRGNPRWDSLFRVLQTLHLRLKFERLPA